MGTNSAEIVLMLPLPASEWFWLRRLQEVTGDHPSAIVASMLRMIRVDDEAAHEEDKCRTATIITLPSQPGPRGR